MDNFPPCPICGVNSWKLVYSGSIRDGIHENWKESEVRRCDGCGVDRLSEDVCLQHAEYESKEYRAHLAQDHSSKNHFSTHDELAKFTLDTLWPRSLRDLTVADVGCGGGALLDHLSGLAKKLIAIEPSIAWSDSLKARGYEWEPSAASAAKKWHGKVDIVLSTQVIEHVEDPRDFLSDISKLLTPEGVAVISTPNRKDILMELMADEFPKFFYRSQHRWAFDEKSLSKCASLAGLNVVEVKHVHRYGLANAMNWYRYAKPMGRQPVRPLGDAIDMHWKAWLESTGQSDNLYLILVRNKH
jgi:2-polyprenyl-3-methyl-5-hydroxy-6-metoxy-1,4-benzoquinol methylase